MIQLNINGQPRELAKPLTIAELLVQLRLKPKEVAVEVNEVIVPFARHQEQTLRQGDRVEIVGLVEGGSGEPEQPADKPLVVGKFRLKSRLFTGTGKYPGYDVMR